MEILLERIMEIFLRQQRVLIIISECRGKKRNQEIRLCVAPLVLSMLKSSSLKIFSRFLSKLITSKDTVADCFANIIDVNTTKLLLSN